MRNYREHNRGRQARDRNESYYPRDNDDFYESRGYGGASRYAGDEDYFGSGRMQYGQGYRAGTPYRDREDESYDYNRPSRSYTGSYDYDADREWGGGAYRDRNRYGRNPQPYRRSEQPYGMYGSRFPESERGYDQKRWDGRRDERGWWDRTSDEVASWFGDEEAERRRRMDYRRDESYRGRGPKGYTRSDERITEDISDRLTDSDFLDASNIEINASGGDVTLMGTVETRYEKRLAESLAEDVSGVSNVENRLRVSRNFADAGTTEETVQRTRSATP
jgi:hypothetical protein